LNEFVILVLTHPVKSFLLHHAMSLEMTKGTTLIQLLGFL